ncbi:HD domain-containing protein [bacterium]|nr:HD domain-containing protein [candidate division CSSED10-310 bacterium]
MYQIDSQKKNEIQDTNVQLRLYARDLSSIISNLRLANQNLKKAYQDTVLRLAMAAEFRDLDTGDHIVRIGRYCALLAEKAGLDKVFAELILYASPMHDLGKIGIPDSILLKNGALTQSEKVIMRAHPTIGARILGGSDSEILQMAHEIALTHHEQWDGNGYPYGLAGKDIPIAGRIAAIVDVFDALTSRRPYKEPFSVDESVRIMTTEMPTHFDPDLLQTFVAHVNEFVLIREAVEAEQIENVSRDSLFGKIADLKE